MRTRTNLHIDDDALTYASEYADARGIRLGVAVSELIRRAEQTPEVSIRASARLKTDEHGFLVVKANGPVITAQMVRDESEDDLA